jgi:hypothetical protein
MNLAEAHYLACTIHQSGLAKLITIGHFIPIEAITDESPWACAIQLPSGQLTTIWSTAEWTDVALRSAAAPSSHDSPSRDPTPAPTHTSASIIQAPRPDDAHRRQPTLF